MRVDRLLIAAFLMPVLGACDYGQLNRDNLRYASEKRGTEIYRLGPGVDSLQAAEWRSETALRHYERHLAAFRSGGSAETYQELKERFDIALEAAKEQHKALPNGLPGGHPEENAYDGDRNATGVALSYIERRAGEIDSAYKSANGNENRMVMARQDLARLASRLSEILAALDYLTQLTSDLPEENSHGQTAESNNEQNKKNYAPPIIDPHIPLQNNNEPSQSFQIAPTTPFILTANFGTRQVTTDHKDNGSGGPPILTRRYERGPDPDYIRMTSSIASVSQMRDLLTEPSFPNLLPVERHVDLGCLPPPESAAFEATMKLEAELEQAGADGSRRSAEGRLAFANNVVQLFEESERTLFLQYALFRLCEMSINAPAEFRNVYPVIIHDIVRRTAEMNQEALAETERRRAEEAKVEREKAEMQKIAAQRELAEQELRTRQRLAELERDRQYRTCVADKLEGLSVDEIEAKSGKIKTACISSLDPETKGPDGSTAGNT